MVILNLLSLLDSVLTFYTLFLDKKKGVLDPSREKNPWINYIFKKHGIGPLVFLIVTSITQTIITIFGIFCPEIGIAFISGVLLTVNMYHTFNIQHSLKNWNFKTYWDYRKELIIHERD